MSDRARRTQRRTQRRTRAHRGAHSRASGADIAFLRPAALGDELVAVAVERAVAGRSGLYDVTVRAGASVVAEFRGRTRRVPGLPGPA